MRLEGIRNPSKRSWIFGSYDRAIFLWSSPWKTIYYLSIKYLKYFDVFYITKSPFVRRHWIKMCFLLIWNFVSTESSTSRISRPEIFLRKGVLKICNKSAEEHRCRSVISIKLLCNFIETALQHGCSPVDLLHIFRTPFLKNTSGWLLLYIIKAPKNLMDDFHLFMIFVFVQ